jgi:hypothetical protein
MPRRNRVLRRPMSSVSLDGLLKTADPDQPQRTKRVKVLTEEQRAAIQNLTHPSQMSHAERKRQFGALGRRLEKSDTLPPGVLAKWECARTDLEKWGPYVPLCIYLQVHMSK